MEFHHLSLQAIHLSKVEAGTLRCYCVDRRPYFSSACSSYELSSALSWSLSTSILRVTSRDVWFTGEIDRSSQNCSHLKTQPSQRGFVHDWNCLRGADDQELSLNLWCVVCHDPRTIINASSWTCPKSLHLIHLKGSSGHKNQDLHASHKGPLWSVPDVLSGYLSDKLMAREESDQIEYCFDKDW